MKHIPPEILGYIFEYATNDRYGSTTAIHFPRNRWPKSSMASQLAVSAVSRRWRQIAHSRSSLWSNISLDLCGLVATDAIDCLSELLSRYKGDDMKAEISDGYVSRGSTAWTSVDRALFQLLLDKSDCMSSLRLYVSGLERGYIKERLDMCSGRFPSLRRIALLFDEGSVFQRFGNAFLVSPKLSELSLVFPLCDYVDASFSDCFPLDQVRHFSGDTVSVGRLLQALKKMTRLEHLTISDLITAPSDLLADKCVVLPALTTLEGIDDWKDDVAFMFFSSIQTPCLKDLRARAQHIPFISSIRSACGFKLTSLSITGVFVGDSGRVKNMAAFIAAMPTIGFLSLSFLPHNETWHEVQAAPRAYSALVCSLLSPDSNLHTLRLGVLVLTSRTARVLVKSLESLLAQKSLRNVSVELRSVPVFLKCDDGSDPLVDASMAWEELESFANRTLTERHDLKLQIRCEIGSESPEVRYVTNIGHE